MNDELIRIAVTGIYHETNTFAPGFTELSHFQSEWIDTGEMFNARYVGTLTSMGGVLDAAARNSAVRLQPGLYTATTPSGTVKAEAAERLLEASVDSVFGSPNGIFLIMHGAMVSEQYSDLEGELLRRLRAKFGAEIPIALTIDLHANVSPEMVQMSDVVVGYDTYPHIDMYERAFEAFELLVRRIRCEIRPIRAYGHTGMLVVPQGMMTDSGSMKKLMDRAFAIESDARVLNVTVAGGFPYSDVQFAGMTFVVTTDGDRSLADRYASELVELALGYKEHFGTDCVPPQEAIVAALSELSGPVILAEGSDNVGGGAPADSTHVLVHLTDVSQKSLIIIRDEEAVSSAFESGVGGTFTGQVGGKTDSLHGNPVLLTGRVRTLFDGQYRHVGPYMTGQLADMGKTAVVECGQLTVILTENRVPPWDLGHIRSVGLWPDDFKIIVAKSAIAWKAALGAFAKRVIQIDSPGCCSANLSHFDYRNVLRPVYPIDADFKPRFDSTKEEL